MGLIYRVCSIAYKLRAGKLSSPEKPANRVSIGAEDHFRSVCSVVLTRDDMSVNLGIEFTIRPCGATATA